MKQGGHETSQWAKILGTSRVIRSGIQVTKLLGLIFPSYPKQQGMVRLSTSLPLYSRVVCTHPESEIEKKPSQKTYSFRKKKKNFFRMLFLQAVCISTSPMFSPQ